MKKSGKKANFHVEITVQDDETEGFREQDENVYLETNIVHHSFSISFWSPFDLLLICVWKWNEVVWFFISSERKTISSIKTGNPTLPRFPQQDNPLEYEMNCEKSIASEWRMFGKEMKTRWKVLVLWQSKRDLLILCVCVYPVQSRSCILFFLGYFSY